MKINSGRVGRRYSLEGRKRMCGRWCPAASPGDPPDPATTQSEEHVGRTELYLFSVAWGKKVKGDTGDRVYAKARRQ